MCYLDLTDEIDAWFECLATFLPACRTHFPMMLADENSRFELSEELISRTPDIVGMNFIGL